ncbi:hypothetical protein BGX24_009408, partial [Mortierella sp. AD032]
MDPFDRDRSRHAYRERQTQSNLGDDGRDRQDDDRERHDYNGFGDDERKRFGDFTSRRQARQLPQQLLQTQQSLTEVTKAKRRRKGVGQNGDASSAGPKKLGRPRKDPSTRSSGSKVTAKNNKGKGKVRAKYSADPNNLYNSTQPDLASVKDAKSGGDSEFETDDDMVEIISTRIPQSLKRKAVISEKHICRDRQEEEGESEFGSSSGEEGNYEGYEGHNHIEMQQAGNPSSSALDTLRNISNISVLNIARTKEGEKFDELEARSILQQVAVVMTKMHEKNLIHGYLQSSNILLDDDGRVLANNFCMARRCQSPIALSGNRRGNQSYMPPERLVTPHRFGKAADVWAFGILMFEMLVGRLPERND